MPVDRSGIIGRVIEKTFNNITIQTLDGQKELIITGEEKLFTNILLGQIIGAIGVSSENIFAADKLKIITKEMVSQCIKK